MGPVAVTLGHSTKGVVCPPPTSAGFTDLTGWQLGQIFLCCIEMDTNLILKARHGHTARLSASASTPLGGVKRRQLPDEKGPLISQTHTLMGTLGLEV